jgi:hypothetical protein
VGQQVTREEAGTRANVKNCLRKGVFKQPGHRLRF